MPNHSSGRDIDLRPFIVQSILQDADRLLQKLDQNDFGEAAAIMSLAVDAIAKRKSQTILEPC